MTELKPYPAYKDSSVPWLGQVPEHWEVRRLKSALVRNDSGYWGSDFSSSGCLVLRSNEQTVDGGWQIVAPARRLLSSKEQAESRLVEGDLVITKSSGSSKHIGKTSLVTPAIAAMECCFSNFMQRIRLNVRVDPRLAWYWLNNKVGRDQLVYESNTTTGLANLNGTIIGNLCFSFPPLAEQAAIVRYLDHADRKVRHVIRARQQLIKLLTEQKQAIIQRAVTRGLDPSVRLKPSGVPWLGDVPEHWEILPLKRWVSTKITDGPHETPPLMDDGIPFMSAESMVGGRFDFGHRRGFISRELHEVYCRKCRPQRDDIFMCKSGATTGKVSIVETDEEFSIWSPLALIRVSPQRILPRLLFSVLQSSYVQRQVHDTWSYGTQPNLAMEAMERLVIGLPPVNEQREILTHLEQETAPLAEAIDRARREIDLLREYRTRLIADVVTGNLDVRGVKVPDDETDAMPEDVETIDDVDAADQGDDAVEGNSESSAEENA